MGSTKLSALMGALMSAAAVSAHGHVKHVIIDGVEFPGYNPSVHPYMSNPPTVIGWAADQLDLGFVAPSAYDTPDMICHRSATPAKGHAQVRAGDSITLQWTPWPESHHGPIIDWLAPCNGPCQNVNKEDLRFFKITGQGLITPGAPGYYAADKLIDQGEAWVVKIPENIKPGHYVLRHEIIALHGSGSYDGTQSYPQCFNLEIVGGSGTSVPAGVPGTQLYTDTDPGILLNIYDNTLTDYPVPGGPIVPGGVSAAPQNIQTATATGVPTPANGGGNPAPTSNNPSPTTAPTTTLVTRTTSSSSSTTSSANGAQQTPYGQCGGNGWTGPTTCSGGVSCKVLNDWYHQCQP